jgi:hypothetical protein
MNFIGKFDKNVNYFCAVFDGIVDVMRAQWACLFCVTLTPIFRRRCCFDDVMMCAT